jgi:hypothetical protein
MAWFCSALDAEPKVLTWTIDAAWPVDTWRRAALGRVIGRAHRSAFGEALSRGISSRCCISGAAGADDQHFGCGVVKLYTTENRMQ